MGNGKGQPRKRDMDAEALAKVAEIQFSGVLSQEEPNGTVAMPVRDHMNMETVRSILLTDWPHPIDQIFAGGNLLALQRNNLVNRMRGEWILFIDDDMVWRPDAVKSLLAGREELRSMGHEPDVFGALCFKRAIPHQPTLLVKHESGPYNFLENWETDIVEVDATGMAFAIISKSAFERIADTPMPSYDERVQFRKSPDFFKWQGTVGEDIRFCQDVKSSGGRVFVDTRVSTGHMSELQIGYKQFLREVLDRQPVVSRARKKINDEMGLLTMTRKEAQRRYDILRKNEDY